MPLLQYLQDSDHINKNLGSINKKLSSRLVDFGRSGGWGKGRAVWVNPLKKIRDENLFYG